MRTYVTIVPIVVAALAAQVCAQPQIRVLPEPVPAEEELRSRESAGSPPNLTVQIEFVWGRNLSDFDADGAVNLADYARFALCFGVSNGSSPTACDTDAFAQTDLDADGDVDTDDESLFRRSMRPGTEFVVEDVSWAGVRESQCFPDRSVAQLGFDDPGSQFVRAEVLLFDPVTNRRVSVIRESTIHLQADGSTVVVTAIDADSRTHTVSSPCDGLTDARMELKVFAWSNSPRGLHQLTPGDLVFFQIGASLAVVDGFGCPNAGLSGVVYDVFSPEAETRGYMLNEMEDLPSGYSNFDPRPVLYTVSDLYYRYSDSSTQPFYHGGWGFTSSGLPHGGMVDRGPGWISAAGELAPLTWVADNNPNYPGLQPPARLGVGHGLYTFPPDDPILAGHQGGFGQSLNNASAEGDGTWVFQQGMIDTAGWAPRTYHFEIVPLAADAFWGNLDYSEDMLGGFRQHIAESARVGAEFSFSLLDGPPDCNSNGTDDALDIAQGNSLDCNHDNMPDECETECNGNNIPDGCDISAGTSTDCNGNGIPDECEPDCDGNGIADNCETDTDGDAVIDACDACMDSDGDGFGDPGYPDDTCPPDLCPDDPNKSEPGACGCGNADTDSDNDATPNCFDGCPFDPNKTEPETCGCGVDEIDTNGDNVPDCGDACPDDPNKTHPGGCGCGVPDLDADADGTLDCDDGCPNDAAKIEPGLCGCGSTDNDFDGDLIPDCMDGCPTDPSKIHPGHCGCHTPDTDSDADGTPNCVDDCSQDPLKTSPGVCGCGISDADGDADGQVDCVDACPTDPNKSQPGICGCGVLDTDNDGDGALNCFDDCPFDPLKIEFGECGCGAADVDLDGDETADCNDECLDDPLKSQPGQCGCGQPDNDSDGDGHADCMDACPTDASKVQPGVCGCHQPDTDSDNDGTLDCLDACPMDANKTSPGICGCGRRDQDPDLDGIPSCNDGCPFDFDKTDPGICGCGLPDNDSDGDLMFDCHDRCPNDPLKITPAVCGCGESDEDTNSDGLPDCLNGFRFDSLFGVDPNGRNRDLGSICGSIGMVSLGMTAMGLWAMWFAQRPPRTRRRHSAKANESA